MAEVTERYLSQDARDGWPSAGTEPIGVEFTRAYGPLLADQMRRDGYSTEEIARALGSLRVDVDGAEVNVQVVVPATPGEAFEA